MKKIFLVLVVILTYNCSDSFLSIKPTSDMDSSSVFSDEKTVEAAMTGVYHALVKPGSSYSYNSPGFQSFIPIYNEIRGDGMMANDNAWFSGLINVYQYSVEPDQRVIKGIWLNAYFAIRSANNVINADLSKISKGKADRYTAECKTIRALCLYELVHVYAQSYAQGADKLGVPVVLENVKDMKPERNTVGEVYTQILKDLDEAIPDLKKITSLKNDALVMTQNFAHGLKARVYLDQAKYQEAKESAEKSIEGIALISGNDFAKGLSNGTEEDILRFTNTSSLYNQYRTMASWFDDPDGMGKDIAVYKEVAESFADDDIRKTFFVTQADYKLSNVGSYDDAIFKNARQARIDKGYKDAYDMYGKFPRKNVSASSPGSVGLGDYVAMRAGEMYLVIAECEARLGTTSLAQDKLLEIQKRSITSATKSTKIGDDLINEILEEKKKELLGEGHRFRDLLRLNKDFSRPNSSWHAASKDIKMGSENIIFPIPQDEINANKKMVQNPGYGD